MSVGGGSTDSHEIPNLSATVTYRVSIVSVNGVTRSSTTGPVLAARGELCWSSQTQHDRICKLYISSAIPVLLNYNQTPSPLICQVLVHGV